MTTNENLAPRKLRPGIYEYKGLKIEHITGFRLAAHWVIVGEDGQYKSVKAAVKAIDAR